MATFCDWIFVLCRTEPGTVGPAGLSFLLVPLRQPGIELRPIRQMTGEREFNETFFDGARTPAENIVGEVGAGWRVAMGLLSFERGVGTLAQQASFWIEFQTVVDAARRNGAEDDPLLRRRLAESYAELVTMRYSALRMLSDSDNASMQPAAMTYKLYWAGWHRRFCELAMDILGPSAEITSRPDYDFGDMTRAFLGSRSDTIYGGTNQIQRNIVAERALGLPKEPRGDRQGEAGKK